MYYMKKVRFESPVKALRVTKMNDIDCHSPRPFIERQIQKNPALYDIVRRENPNPDLSELHGSPRTVLYNSDPVQRYECSNSFPYPNVNKTNISAQSLQGSQWLPSNDLELSMLDASSCHQSQPFFKPILRIPENRSFQNVQKDKEFYLAPTLSAIENKPTSPPNILTKDNNFFIRRSNLDKFSLNIDPLQNQLNKISIDKENNPIVKKADVIKHRLNANRPQYCNKQLVMQPASPQFDQDCMCHHCTRVMQKMSHTPCHWSTEPLPHGLDIHNQCSCVAQPNICSCYKPQHASIKSCKCDNPVEQTFKPQNPVDKKEWAVKMYQQNITNSMDIEKQHSVSKEKREPTVSDLLKIIKLQNEQLQLLQEKVDKFISGAQNIQTVQSMTDHIALNRNEHKISIGVMTSFEMVRTSRIINKEIVKQSNETSQLLYDKSQVSVKEVIKSQPVNINFLDGITPVEKTTQEDENNCNNPDKVQQNENVVDEKTFNDLSLCNVHIDNSTTPMMSPEPSLYLDVRDYSDSETSSVGDSKVGWTYYNKVMTHVNGMLEESDMPSSASALYRNAKHQCMQMQIDKTNVSVTKRVKFGDDYLCVNKPHIYAASTDTSLKMNQLAAKYLKGCQIKRPVSQPKPVTTPIEMSFATRNYMERHKILQGIPHTPRSPLPNDLPKFLDITALKQQPKFL